MKNKIIGRIIKVRISYVLYFLKVNISNTNLKVRI